MLSGLDGMRHVFHLSEMHSDFVGLRSDGKGLDSERLKPGEPRTLSEQRSSEFTSMHGYKILYPPLAIHSNSIHLRTPYWSV